MMADETDGMAAARESAEAAGALHDFNNALQAMAASLRHLQRKIARGEAGDLLELVEALGTQVMRIGRLGAALTSPASVGTPLDWSKVGVGAFLRAMAPQITALLDGNTRLELVLEPEAGQVSCDPARLESAIRNLVLNARDAMPDGGVLTVRMTVVELGQDPAQDPTQDPAQDPAQDGRRLGSGRFTAITVTDTGCGMGPEMLDRCFDPFVTTKTVPGGTGLGLFQLRAFAEQAGGTVRLQSRQGEGTEATILLPCSDPATPSPDLVRSIV